MAVAEGAAVLFDLFETLVTSAEQGAGHPRELFPDRQAFDRVWANSRRRRMTTVMPFADLLAEAFAEAGLPVDERLTLQLVHTRALAKAATLAATTTEVVDLLSDLRDRGLRVGVVSNASIDEAEPWSGSPLESLVDVAVFSCYAGCLKPERAIYERAMQQLEVAPEQVVFVGDGGSDELAGAQRAGIMRVFRATWFVDAVEDADGTTHSGGNDRVPALSRPSDLLRELC